VRSPDSISDVRPPLSTLLLRLRGMRWDDFEPRPILLRFL